jgi:hypothetical protein
VRVFVDGKKIPADEQGKPAQPLDVTAYLSIIAGFVEFPIVIKEGDRKTIVLHPKQDAESARQRFGKEFQIHQLDLSYPWDRAILPQDIPTAREFLREQRWDIASDLGQEGCNGILTRLIPNNGIDMRVGFVAGDEATEVIIRGKKQDLVQQVRLSESGRASGLLIGVKIPPIGLSRSSYRQSWAYAVYRDGIFLATASPPRSFSGSDFLPPPHLIVNLSKLRARRVDLARRQILGGEGRWDLPIYQACVHYLLKNLLKDLEAMDPAERLYQLGRFIAFYDIEVEDLWQVFPHSRWPLSFLEPGGHLNFLEWQELATEPIYLSPELLEIELMKIHGSRWLGQKGYEGILTNWVGDRCLCAFPDRSTIYSNESMATGSAQGLWKPPIEEKYLPAAVRFLNPPWEGDPPLLQEIWAPMHIPENLPDNEAILEKAVEDPAQLNPVEKSILLDEKILKRLPKAIEFSKPFEQLFAYGSQAMNLKHPMTQALVRFAAVVELSKRRKILAREQIGHLEDGIYSLRRYFPSMKSEEERFSNALHHFLSLVREARLLDVARFKDLVLAQKEFVPGTPDMRSHGLEERLRKTVTVRPFGEPMT